MGCKTRFPETAPSEKSWAFEGLLGGSGTVFIGGYYDYSGGNNDFNPSINWGTTNSSYAAHFFVVAAAGGSGGTDTVIRVTGTSITDSAVRTPGDTEDITLDDAGSAGAYYETGKKWIGQVSIAHQSGPDIQCNYGWCKYWDNNNTDFTVSGSEVVWISARNSSTSNILLRHHKATGWTYNAGADPTPPAAIADLQTDHDTEYQTVNGDYGAWKRSNLNTDINGATSEGTIIEVITSGASVFLNGTFMLRIKQRS